MSKCGSVEFTKCDFCDKEAVGYTSMQMFVFCEDHEKEADEKFSRNWEQMEKELEAAREQE